MYDSPILRPRSAHHCPQNTRTHEPLGQKLAPVQVTQASGSPGWVLLSCCGEALRPLLAICPNLWSGHPGTEPPAGRHEQLWASGKSFVVNCSQFMDLSFPSGEQRLSVMRALSPDDDISSSESSPGQTALEGSAGAQGGKCMESGPGGGWGRAHEGHQVGTLDDLLEGGTRPLAALANCQARHRKGTGTQKLAGSGRGCGREGATGEGVGS